MNKSIVFVCLTLLFASCIFEPTETVTNPDTASAYSKMIVVNTNMYRVEGGDLATYDISDTEDITLLDRQMVNFTIESMYYVAGILFIGSEESLHIFEIDENNIPQRKGTTDYIEYSAEQTSCDPVISDGRYAYVTLSSLDSTNSSCQRQTSVNELRIYDIQDLLNPVEILTIEMINPKGLAYDDDLLFVTENEGGLKVFNKTDIENIQLLYHFDDVHTYDVIAKDGLLIAVGQSAIYQYDYNSTEDITLISTLDL